jgi:uncharacterized protein YcnI
VNRIRLGFASFLAIVVVLGWTGVASAHVTLDPAEAEAGGFTILHFQVPNESDTASTVKVEIAMPDGVILPTVLAQPVAGWDVSVQRSPLETPIETDDGTVTEAVSVVTFEGGEIAPGEFQLFDLEVGPLPDEAGSTLAFPAVQTYSDGTEVRWVDIAQTGQPEPEHPAPSLHLVSAAGDSDGASSGGSSSDSTAKTLAIIGIALGAVGVALGGFALARGRKNAGA